MSLRDLTKRVFSDQRAVEGAKSLIVFDASGQALTLVFKILAEDLNSEALLRRKMKKL